MEDCEKWRLNPLVNPKTKRKIKPGGHAYKKLLDECGDLGGASQTTTTRQTTTVVESDCDKWRRDPLTNPKTGRKIKRSSPIYKKLEKDCNELSTRQATTINEPSTSTIQGQTINEPSTSTIQATTINEPSTSTIQGQTTVVVESDCDKWRRNPLTNPKTGRKIKRSSPIYKKLEKECSESSTRQATTVLPSIQGQTTTVVESDCDKWRRDPLTNPKTDRKIKYGGPIYKKLEKECSDSSIEEETLVYLNPELCEEWFKNKKIDPRTKKTLTPEEYKSVAEKCIEFRIKELDDECEKFFNDTTLNPKTNKKITRAEYNYYHEACQPIYGCSKLTLQNFFNLKYPITPFIERLRPNTEIAPVIDINRLKLNRVKAQLVKDHNITTDKINSLVEYNDHIFKSDYVFTGFFLSQIFYYYPTFIDDISKICPQFLYLYGNNLIEPPTYNRSYHRETEVNLAQTQGIEYIKRHDNLGFDLAIIFFMLKSFKFNGTNAVNLRDIRFQTVEVNFDHELDKNKYDVYTINGVKYYRKKSQYIHVVNFKHLKFTSEIPRKRIGNFIYNYDRYTTAISGSVDILIKNMKHSVAINILNGYSEPPNGEDGTSEPPNGEDGTSEPPNGEDGTSEPPNEDGKCNEYFIPLVSDYPFNGEETILYNSLPLVNVLVVDSNEFFRDKTDISGTLNHDYPTMFPMLFPTLKKQYITVNITPKLFVGPLPQDKNINCAVLNLKDLAQDIPKNFYNCQYLNINGCNITNIDDCYFDQSHTEEITIENSCTFSSIIGKLNGKNYPSRGLYFSSVGNTPYNQVDLNEVIECINRNSTSRRVYSLTLKGDINIIFPETNFNNIRDGCKLILDIMNNPSFTSVHPSLFNSNRDKIRTEIEECGLSRQTIVSFLTNIEFLSEVREPSEVIFVNFELDQGVPMPLDAREREDLEFNGIISKLFNDRNLRLENIDQSTCNYTIKQWINKIYINKHLGAVKVLLPDIKFYLQEMDSNSEFKDAACEIIEGAGRTCGDRVILSLLYISLQHKLYTIQPTIENIKKIYSVLVNGCYILDILEQIAREKVNSIRNVDEIEVYLAYPIKLRDKFSIPICANTMLFFGCASVSTDDLDVASLAVEAQLNNKERIVDYLSQQSLWTRLISEIYPDIFDDVDSLADNLIIKTKELMDQYSLK
jgi:hypothetical protein